MLYTINTTINMSNNTLKISSYFVILDRVLYDNRVHFVTRGIYVIASSCILMAFEERP